LEARSKLIAMAKFKFLYPGAKTLSPAQTKNSDGTFSAGHPTMIVMHYTASGSGLSSAKFLHGPHKPPSSAHFVVDRDGTVWQLSDLSRVTWHAGKSSWKDAKGKKVEHINDYGVGIEVANWGFWRKEIAKHVPDPAKAGWLKAKHPNGGPIQWWEPYQEKQMAVLEDLTRWLLKAFPKIHCVVGHEQIAPSRKVDPGPAFPWGRVKALLPKKASPAKPLGLLGAVQQDEDGETPPQLFKDSDELPDQDAAEDLSDPFERLESLRNKVHDLFSKDLFSDDEEG
jgi:N-acetyl-anhydromuramyl-L-alanine amidase AmpD